jgi:hypothetical protein
MSAEYAGKYFRISCQLNPPDLQIIIKGVRPARHASSLEVRSGGHIALVPLISTLHSSFLEAVGSVPETFLFMLNSNSPFAISYAGQTFHLESLDEPSREAFAVACGKSAGLYVPPAR